MKDLPKIIIVDDHKIFREGLKTLLVNETIANVIGEASNGQELLNLLQHNKPDLIITDISMPVMDGIEATRRALSLDSNLKILVLTSYGDEEYYHQMIEAGVKGFILKNSGIMEVERAISTIINDEAYFSNEVLRRIIKNIKTAKSTSELLALTAREKDVLQLICETKTNEEISEIIHLSVQTIKNYRSSLLSKTGAKNTAGLVVYAIKNKLFQF